MNIILHKYWVLFEKKSLQLIYPFISYRDMIDNWYILYVSFDAFFHPVRIVQKLVYPNCTQAD